jgi:HK97 family phage portal protein
VTILGELILGKRASTMSSFHPSANPASWWPVGGAQSLTGLQVDERSSLGHSAVYQAVQLIAGLMSVLPCHVLERQGEDRREARRHPLWRVLHEEPNPESSWAQWQTAQMLNKLTHGNRYAEIEFTDSGRGGMRLWHLPSEMVTPRRVFKDASGGLTFETMRATPGSRRTGGTILYEVRTNAGGPVYIEPERMLHVPDMSWNGAVGFSRIGTALESIAVGQARLRAVAAIYGNDSTPGGVIERPNEAPALSPTGVRNRLAAWEATHGATSRKGRVAYLQEGEQFKAVSFSPKEAMVIEAGQFSILEVAHIFNLRPHWLGHPGNSSTYSNVESEFVQLAQVTLMPHVRADELEFRRKLLFPAERESTFIEYDLKGLLRGDSAARAAFYRAMAELKAMTPNMIAQAENLGRVPPEQGGDTYGSLASKGASGDLPANEKPPQAPPAPRHLAAAFRPLLQAALDRAVTREAAAIRKAAERPGLAGWLPGFYHEQRGWVAKVVGPVLDSYEVAQGGAGGGAAAFAERWARQRQDELRAVATDRVGEVLERWERELPAQVAEQEIPC